MPPTVAAAMLWRILPRRSGLARDWRGFFVFGARHANTRSLCSSGGLPEPLQHRSLHVSRRGRPAAARSRLAHRPRRVDRVPSKPADGAGRGPDLPRPPRSGTPANTLCSERPSGACVAWRSAGRTVPPFTPIPEGLAGVPAQEKGVDVALAVDLVRLAAEGSCDVAVVFSRDTDLMPALEAVRDVPRLRLHVEVATWQGSSRLRYPGTNRPWCHNLTEADYRAVQDTTDYRRPSKRS